MKLVFFTHPPFLKMASMTRYASWLADGMRRRGHEVDIWAPEPYFYRLPVPARFKKWMGYVDQYVLFPRRVKRQVARQAQGTLFVFADHALGPWVPLAAARPHVVHCHDFLAQDSALGRIPHNPVSRTGRVYQRYIRHGFRKAHAFIAISQKTKDDLMAVVDPSSRCDVVYNGVNPRFCPIADVAAQRAALGTALGIDLSRGFVLHVGVNTWYKNRRGALAAYEAWRRDSAHRGQGRGQLHESQPLSASSIPLLMVGPPPPSDLAALRNRMQAAEDVHFLTAVSDEQLAALYGTATVFLFPSIAEGFGWPIAEAMASGCPVITTGIAPMTEVAGEAAFLIPAAMLDDTDADMPWATPWAVQAAEVLAQVTGLSDSARREVVALGLAQVKRFDSVEALDRVEAIYLELLAQQRR